MSGVTRATPPQPPPPPRAQFAGVAASGLVESADLRKHPEKLASGWWAVVATFEGELTGWRFADVRREPPPVRSATPEDGAARVGAVPAPWRGPAADT